MFMYNSIHKIFAYARILCMNKNQKRHLERLKDFLDSDTSKAKIANVALCILAVASVPLLAFIAASMGNAVQVFKMFQGSKKYSKIQIGSAFQSIKHQKLIEYVCDNNGKAILKITKKGESRLRVFGIELIKIKRPKEWDGKWRLVMFDIPMRFTKGREALRYRLKKLNFFQFQKSVWVYPYPCKDEITFIADFFGVGKYVEILTIENTFKNKKLSNHFHLS